MNTGFSRVVDGPSSAAGAGRRAGWSARRCLWAMRRELPTLPRHILRVLAGRLRRAGYGLSAGRLEKGAGHSFSLRRRRGGCPLYVPRCTLRTQREWRHGMGHPAESAGGSGRLEEDAGPSTAVALRPSLRMTEPGGVVKSQRRGFWTSSRMTALMAPLRVRMTTLA
jgi:hypothetical protein